MPPGEFDEPPRLPRHLGAAGTRLAIDMCELVEWTALAAGLRGLSSMLNSLVIAPHREKSVNRWQRKARCRGKRQAGQAGRPADVPSEPKRRPTSYVLLPIYCTLHIAHSTLPRRLTTGAVHARTVHPLPLLWRSHTLRTYIHQPAQSPVPQLLRCSRSHPAFRR